MLNKQEMTAVGDGRVHSDLPTDGLMTKPDLVEASLFICRNDYLSGEPRTCGWMSDKTSGVMLE